MDIDVAIPTKESADVISGTLRGLHSALANSTTSLNNLILIDDHSEDETVQTASRAAEDRDMNHTILEESTTLPEARTLAIDNVETDWFLFLDDDVRLSHLYLTNMADAVASAVGGVQGRKISRQEPNADWTRRRARRAGTHATLLRTEAVDGIEIPDGVTVLEDEYIRREVERRGYLWTFNHQARFRHDNQGRHPIGWTEGYVGGRYGLSAFHDVALNVPFALATKRNPIPHTKRALGWIAGRLSGNRTEPPTHAGGGA